MKQGLEHFGCTATDSILQAFDTYEQLLLAWNEKMNLTAITAHAEIVDKHFIDSVSLQQFLPQGSRLADVGSGAGFPGIPLKIVRDDLSVTLFDALAKRITFLDAVIDALKLQNMTAVHGRAEDIGRDKQRREKFDAVTARAVASLPVLCEYCLPLLKVGGVFLAQKGPSGAEEAAAAANAIKILGGSLVEIRDVFWKDTTHTVVVIAKIGHTPPSYPRQAGKPQKSPL